MVATESSSEISARNKLGLFAGPLAVVGAVLVAVVVSVWGTQGDLGNMWPPTKAFVAGDFGGVYPEGTSGTSLTGWIALVLLPYTAARLWMADLQAFTFAGLVAIPLLLVSVRVALRDLWPGVSNGVAWGAAFVATVLPTTLACWFNYYHPQDVAAVALVVFGVGLAARARWGWAGVVFGLAVMTRQWAILGALPVAGLAGKDVWKFAVGGAGVCGVLLAPVVLGGSSDWLAVVTASSARATTATFFGQLRVAEDIAAKGSHDGANVVLWIGRAAPVIIAALMGVAAFIWKGRLLASRGIAVLVPLALTGLALRMVFEGADYLYYWVPFPVLLLLLVPAGRHVWAGVIALSVFPWAVNFLLADYWGVATLEFIRSVLVLFLAVAFIIVSWVFTPVKNVVGDPDATVRSKPENRTPVWAWCAAGGVVVVTVALMFASVIPMSAADTYETESERNIAEKS